MSDETRFWSKVDEDGEGANVPDEGEGGDSRARAREKARRYAESAVDEIKALMGGGGGRGAMARLAAARSMLQVAFDAQFEPPSDSKTADGEIRNVTVIPQEEAVKAARTLRLAELAERKRAG